MRPMLRLPLVSLVIASTLSIASEAFSQVQSQDAGSENPPSVDEPLRIKENVEVTATRGMIETDKSPASSTVITRRDLERRNYVAVDQALSTVEGVSAFRARGIPDNGIGIGMRGFTGRSSGQSRVLVLLDGQPINDPYLGSVNWAALPIDEIDRVEVVRGPFSSLYGGNAMGGVVNVLTRPIDRRSFEVFGQYGTHETGAASGRFSDWYFGRLGITVGYSQLRTGGYPAQVVTRTSTNSTSTGGVPVTGVERFATSTGGVAYGVGVRGNNWYTQHGIRARAEYRFGTGTLGSFQFIRQSTETGWDPYASSVQDSSGRTLDSGDAIFLEDGTWKRITLLPSQFLGAIQGGASNTYQGQLLRATSSRGQFLAQVGVVDTPRSWTELAGSAATLAGGPGTLTNQRFRGTYANAQWSSTAGRRHAFAVGADTRLDSANIEERPMADYLNDQSAFASRNTYSNGKAFTQGLYVQNRVDLSNALQITLGGRYDYWQSYEGETQANASAALRATPNRSAAALTGKVAAVYAVKPTTTIRASVGSAFRHPSVFELYRDLIDVGSILVGNPLLEPERLVAWEVGVRHGNRKASFDAAVYRNRITDLIYRATDFALDPTGATRRFLNAGEGITHGLELGASFRPAPWLTMRPTYTYTDAIITKNELVPATVGKQVPFVPRHSASATISADRSLWGVAATGRYQSDVFSTEANTDVVNGVPGTYDPFFEADLTVNLRLVKYLTFHVTGENLFDRRYYMFYRNPGRVVLAGVRFRH